MGSDHARIALLDDGHPEPIAKANRAFIVQAVNAHDALVAALKGLFKECAMIHKYGGEIDNAKKADAAIKAAQDALKLAEASPACPECQFEQQKGRPVPDGITHTCKDISFPLDPAEEMRYRLPTGAVPEVMASVGNYHESPVTITAKDSAHAPVARLAEDMIASLNPWFDYTNQAWVVDGVYATCGHDSATKCCLSAVECNALHGDGCKGQNNCYGRIHAGQTPAQNIVEQYANVQSQSPPQQLERKEDLFTHTCSHCGVEITARDSAEIARHLLEKHRDRL